jgi:Ring finger domain
MPSPRFSTLLSLLASIPFLRANAVPADPDGEEGNPIQFTWGCSFCHEIGSGDPNLHRCQQHPILSFSLSGDDDDDGDDASMGLLISKATVTSTTSANSGLVAMAGEALPALGNMVWRNAVRVVGGARAALANAREAVAAVAEPLLGGIREALVVLAEPMLAWEVPPVAEARLLRRIAAPRRLLNLLWEEAIPAQRRFEVRDAIRGAEVLPPMVFTDEELRPHYDLALQLQATMMINDIKQGHETCHKCRTGIYNPDIQRMIMALGILRPTIPPRPLPVIPTVQEREAHAMEQRCAICLIDFEDSESDINKLSCGHFFHQPCTMGWIREKEECPLCKTHIK